VISCDWCECEMEPTGKVVVHQENGMSFIFCCTECNDKWVKDLSNKKTADDLLLQERRGDF
jgi:hypothetical protein